MRVHGGGSGALEGRVLRTPRIRRTHVLRCPALPCPAIVPWYFDDGAVCTRTRLSTASWVWGHRLSMSTR